MKYSLKQFVSAHPKWKKKRDAILTRYIYRPCSFVIAWMFANLGISSNAVSRLTMLWGILACLIYLIPGKLAGVMASGMVFIWIILDCADGDLARTVGALPYGEFLDAAGGYILNGLLFNILGYRAYFDVNSVLYHDPIIVLAGAIAASSDSISRLIYQKYVNSCYELGQNGKVAHDGGNAKLIDRVRVWVDMNLGVGGILPVLLMITNFWGGLYMIVIIYAIYGVCVMIGTCIYLIKKTYYRGKA